MNYYKYMVNLLPPLYRNKRVLDRYMVLGSLMNKVSELIKTLPNMYIIDVCYEEDLLRLGENIGYPKKEKQDFETYRSLLKIMYAKLFIIPTRDEIKKLTKRVTGYYPTIEPLHTKGDKQENDHGYYISYDLTNDATTDALNQVESVIGAGIKINRDYFYKLEGVKLYNAAALRDKDIISVGCEGGKNVS